MRACTTIFEWLRGSLHRLHQRSLDEIRLNSFGSKSELKMGFSI